jgi:hypothetical protein
MVKITESTLSSPIVLQEADELLSLISGSAPPLPEGWQHPKRLIKIAESVPSLFQINSSKLSVLRPSLYPLMFNLENNVVLASELLTDSINDAKLATALYRDAIRSVWEEGSGVAGSCTDMWDRLLDAQAPESLLTLFSKSSFWSGLETTASHCLATQPLSWVSFCVNTANCCVNGEFLLMEIDRRYLLMTWDQVLMFKDSTMSRFLAGCYTVYNPLFSQEGLSFDTLMELLLWQEQCIIQYDNSGYGILKCIEPLFKTALFQTSETLLEDDLLPYDNMLEKMRGKERALSSCTSLIDQLDKIIRKVGSDKRALADGFGMLKLSGHPVVDPIAGVAKVKKLATMEMGISLENSRNLRRHFCHLYSRGFLRKHRRFPALRHLQMAENHKQSRLLEIAQSPMPHLNVTADNYPLSDWDNIRFGAEYLLDEGEDFLSLISDKAISGLRSEIWETWKERITIRVPKLTTSRRALLEVLTREEFSIGDIIRVVQDRTVAHDLYIVCVFPKEREMKPEPRVFAMLPLDIRTYFVNLESNLARGIFRDVGEQTMTMSYLDLKRKFIELSKARNLDVSPYWTVNIELDLESWNVRMRKLVVDPISRDLDDLYGVEDTFNFIHEFFEKSLRILRHPSFPPDMKPAIGTDPIPSNIAYGGGYGVEDHQGGEEGLFQKGWTLFTIAMIKWPLSTFGVDFELIGQADNQVVVAKLPKDRFPGKREVSEFSRNVLLELDRTCALVGHSVKPEECIVATSGFSYGKELILDGATVPSTLKAVSRMFPSRTQDSPTTSSCLAGIWSDGLAATEKTDLTPLTAYLTHLMSAMFLRREMSYSALHGGSVGSLFNWNIMTKPMRSELIQLLLHLPAQIGGLTPGNFCSFLYKGSADPLIQTITALLMISPGFIQLQRATRWLTTRLGLSPSPDITHLLEEPFSIPLQRAPDPLYALKRQVADKLSSINNNKVVQEVLDLSGEEGKNEFIDWVKSLTPFYPKVYHDLYDSSPYTEIDKFASRFTNTRTLIQKTGSEGLSTAGTIISSDLMYWLDLAKRVKSILRTDPELLNRSEACRIADSLRSHWGLGKLEGIGAACPLSVVKVFRSCGQLTNRLCDGVIVGVLSQSTQSNSRLSRGDIEPYLGGSTLPKKTDRGVHIIKSSPPIRKAMTILQIRDIVAEEGSQVWIDIGLWAQARTTLDMKWLEAATPKMYGGSVAHRYSTSTLPEGASLCSLINLSTRLQMSSDLSGSLGSSDLDKMLSYQELFMLMRSVISFLPEHELFGPATFIMELNLSQVPTVQATLLPATGKVSPQPPDLPVNFYLKASGISISSKSEASLSWRGSRFVQLCELPAAHVSVRALRESIRCLVEDALTKRREVQRALENPNLMSTNLSIIDVPESKNLTWEELTQACALASIDLIIHSAIRVTPVMSSRVALGATVFSLVSMVGPSIYSSVANSLTYLKGTPIAGATPLVGYYQQRSSAACFSQAVSRRARDIVQTLNSDNYKNVRRDGFSSSAGTESNIVFSNIVLWIISRDCGLLSMWRELRTVCAIKSKASRELWAEDELLSEFEPILVLMAMSGYSPARIWRTSPQEALRSIRQRLTIDKGELSASNSLRNLVVVPPLRRGSSWFTVGGCLAYDKTGDVDGGRSLTKLVSRNMLRPLAIHSTAWYTWRPVTAITPESCAILGVGVGGLVNLLNSIGTSVIGFDLREVLLSSREHFPNYRPSLCTAPEMYSTHPLSWLTSGDIRDVAFVNQFSAWLSTSLVTLVLIDIEGVSVSERLAIANVVLQHGKSVAVKLFCPGDVHKLVMSIGSQCDPFRWWPNPACPADEAIVVLNHPVVYPLSTPSLTSVVEDTTQFCSGLLDRVNADLDYLSLQTHDSLVFILLRTSVEKPLWESREFFVSEMDKLVNKFLKKARYTYALHSTLILISLVVSSESRDIHLVSSHTLRLISRLAGLIRIKSTW